MGQGLQLKYFVLKPKGTDIHAVASRAAMRVYAHVVRQRDAELAGQLDEWVSNERKEAGSAPTD